MKIDNLVVIKGGAYNDIKRALKQWIELYSEDLQEGLTFQLFKNGNGNHIIQADKRLDNERFYYLINYLKYPERIQYHINIEGFTTGKDKNKLKDKELLVYISPTDTDYDTVFVTTSENENFKMDFGGRITEGRERRKYAYPTDIYFGLSESFRVQNKKSKHKQTDAITNKLEKRFKIVSAIIFFAFASTFFLFKTGNDFLTINSGIAFAVWAWLFFDYKILQVDRLYLSSVILGLAIFFYGYLINEKFSTEDNSTIVLMGTTMPIFLLILQRPLRFTFKKIMNREPMVENPAPSIADFVYMLTLWLTPIVIPVLYYSK